MKIKNVMCGLALAVGVGVTGLVGAGAANAEPGRPCNTPNAPACQPGPGNDWQNRGIDNARQDHKPFNYNGHQVQPMPAGNGAGWGFWFLGRWIPL